VGFLLIPMKHHLSTLHLFWGLLGAVSGILYGLPGRF
jgi:hypothetical protein